MILGAINLISSGCQENQVKDDSSIYLSTPQVYEVVDHKSTVTLPDSLKLGWKGNAVVEVFIGETGKKEGFNLVFFKIYSESSDTLRHYKYSSVPLNQEDYPKTLQRFIPFFSEYVENTKIERRANVKIPPNSKYMVTIPIKIWEGK